MTDAAHLQLLMVEQGHPADARADTASECPQPSADVAGHLTDRHTVALVCSHLQLAGPTATEPVLPDSLARRAPEPGQRPSMPNRLLPT